MRLAKLNHFYTIKGAIKSRKEATYGMGDKIYKPYN